MSDGASNGTHRRRTCAVSSAVSCQATTSRNSTCSATHQRHEAYSDSDSYLCRTVCGAGGRTEVNAGATDASVRLCQTDRLTDCKSNYAVCTNERTDGQTDLEVAAENEVGRRRISTIVQVIDVPNVQKEFF